MTPPSAPCQPACAAPTIPASLSAKRTGAQSAVRMPSASPGRSVTSASARGRNVSSTGAVIVTARPGLALGILTADCAPVLFADSEAGIVGAAHAGWQGALGGVTDATIRAMEAIGARRDRIVAAVGPCIARASYEVDTGFLRRFCEADPENERFFADARTDHYQFDLEAYVVNRLAAAGVGRVEALGRDTYTEDDAFFSYRRATHRGEPTYGRQISIIGL